MHALRTLVPLSRIPPLLLLMTLVGCNSHLPLLMQPVGLVVAPLAYTGQAIDNNLLAGFSNGQFAVAGSVVDDQGAPLGDVQLSVTIWQVTHRDEGYPNQWETRRESHVVSGHFDFTFRNCQVVDMRFSKAGHFNQRVAFLCGLPPDFLKVIETEYCCEPPDGIIVEGLDDGGTLYSTQRAHRIEKRDLKVVLGNRGALPPVVRYQTALTEPRGAETVVDFARQPGQASGTNGMASIRAEGLHLMTTDPQGGFIPLALGGHKENRLPFFRTAPAEGYQRELRIDEYAHEHAPRGRLYRETQGQVWFYFKVAGKFGVGVFTPSPKREHGNSTVTFYLQPNGSRDLGAADPDHPSAE